MDFKEWLNQKDANVDDSQISTVYDKAHIAVELVRAYRPELLFNINTIADLASGAYGLYNSGENQQTVDPSLEQRLIYWGKIQKDKIKQLPRKVLKQYFPQMDARQVKITDTIRVNVRRILSQARNDLEAVLQIASTIVHESMHELEHEQKGMTYEGGPQAEERKFMAWAGQNMNKILQKYPILTTGFPSTPFRST
jgi:hypothetical protein